MIPVQCALIYNHKGPRCVQVYSLLAQFDNKRNSRKQVSHCLFTTKTSQREGSRSKLFNPTPTGWFLALNFTTFVPILGGVLEKEQPYKYSDISNHLSIAIPIPMRCQLTFIVEQTETGKPYRKLAIIFLIVLVEGRKAGYKKVGSCTLTLIVLGEVEPCLFFDLLYW